MIICEPTEELKNSKLWIYLNNISEEYASKSIIFVKEISPILDTIKKHFPYYTRHDAHHSYRVLLRMEQILQEQCLNISSEICLTAQEVYLLICAAYAHDLGMTVFPGEKEGLLSSLNIVEGEGWGTNPNLQEYIRTNHSARGGEYINIHYEKLGIPLNLVSLLNELMKSHNLSIHEMEVQLGIRAAAGEREIDLKQLACVVCIADAIEFSDTRVVDGVLEKLKNETGERELISYRENMKHVCIGDSVAIGDDGRIVCSGSFNCPEVLNLAHKTIDLIESWVRQYCDIDFRAKKQRLRLRGDFVLRNLNIIGVDFERLGIRIKKENIINLIASNSTWANDISIPIKELLQNSVEACRYRMFNTPASRDYSPEIEIYFDKENSTITIRDNGCGMSKNIILNNFLTVGNSRASDPVYKSYNYNSLARFGIGFWSVFTIASEAIVETAPFELLSFNHNQDEKVDGCNFKVSIEEFKDYTVFEPRKMEAGTKITLKVKECISINDIISKINLIIICSKIPIIIKSSDGVNFPIPLKPQIIKKKDVFGAKRKLAEESLVEIFDWEYEDAEIQLVMGLAFRKENNHATFLLSDQRSSMSFVIEDSIRHRQMKSGICGFTVPIPVTYLPFDIGRVGYFTVNILNPKGFSFRLDRRALLSTLEVSTFSKKIMNIVVDGYRSFLRTNNSYNESCIYDLNMQSRMHGGNVFDTYTENKLLICLQNYPDLLCYKLYKVKKGVPISAAETIYVNIEQLLKMNANIWTCQTSASSMKFSTGFSIEAEKLVPVVYDFVAKTNTESIDNYIIEPSIEGSMLFDNNLNPEVYDVQLQYVQNTLLPTNIMKIPLVSMNTEQPSECKIGSIQGQWSGTIYETVLHSHRAMFEFMGRYRLILSKGSNLAIKIKEMYSSGRNYELAEFICLLEEAQNGYVDEKVREYLY